MKGRMLLLLSSQRETRPRGRVSDERGALCPWCHCDALIPRSDARWNERAMISLARKKGGREERIMARVRSANALRG